MRSRGGVPLLAVALAVVGLLLVLLDGDDHDVTTVEYGGTGETGGAYGSTLSVAFDGAWIVPTQSLAGYGLLWLGTLLVAGVVGHRLGGRTGQKLTGSSSTP